MATKKQHFVPRVYLKAWEGKVNNVSEKNKIFDGVYYYEIDGSSVGDGRNIKSIMAKNHLYTIDYTMVNVITECPKIGSDFAKEIKKILDERGVCAYYNNEPLKSNEQIIKELIFLNKWVFKDKNNKKKVSGKSVINSIKNYKNYRIEDRLGEYMETHWNDYIKQWLKPVSNIEKIVNIENNIICGEYGDEEKKNMLTMMLLLMCRNPSFDYLNSLYLIRDMIKKVTKSNDETMRNITRQAYISDIYKIMYDENKFGLPALLADRFKNLGIVIYEIDKNEPFSFITTDNPVAYHYTAVEKNNRNGIYLPLTPNYLLFFCKVKKEYRDKRFVHLVKKEEAKVINRILLNNATSAVVSKEKYLCNIL